MEKLTQTFVQSGRKNKQKGRRTTKSTMPTDKAAQILAQNLRINQQNKAKNLQRFLNKGKLAKTKRRDPLDKNNLMIPVDADTRDFLTAYFDPFRKGPISLPYPPIVSHQNILSIANGSSVTNANGIAWLTIKPCLAMVNDVHFGSVSGATSGDTVNYGAVGTTDIYSSSPYGVSSFTYGDSDTLTGRIVAQGMRVRYTGTTLSAAGDCYTLQLQSRTNEASTNTFNVAAIKNQPAWKEAEFVRNRWHALSRQIQDPSDFMYLTWDLTDNWFAYANNPSIPSLDMANNMVIYIQATANVPFEYEIFTHFEVCGPDLPTRRVIKADANAVQSAQNTGVAVRYKDSTTADSGEGIGTKEGTGKGIGKVVTNVAKEALKGVGESFVKSIFDF
jgi:hypothetical protein